MVIKSIKNNAFEHCAALERVTFPDSTKNVGYMAFSNCINLKYAYLGDGIRKVDISAFYNTNKDLEIGVKDIKNLNETARENLTAAGLEIKESVGLFVKEAVLSHDVPTQEDMDRNFAGLMERMKRESIGNFKDDDEIGL